MAADEDEAVALPLHERAVRGDPGAAEGDTPKSPTICH
jgi:hypothetical protein